MPALHNLAWEAHAREAVEALFDLKIDEYERRLQVCIALDAARTLVFLDGIERLLDEAETAKESEDNNGKNTESSCEETR